jgi:hypothetical protein
VTYIAASQVQTPPRARLRFGRRSGYATAVVFSLTVWAVVGLLVRGLAA